MVALAESESILHALAVAANTGDQRNFTGAHSSAVAVTEQANQARAAYRDGHVLLDTEQEHLEGAPDRGAWLDSMVGQFWVADLLLATGILPVLCALYHYVMIRRCGDENSKTMPNCHRRYAECLVAAGLSASAYLIVWHYGGRVSSSDWRQGALAMCVFAVSICWGWSSAAHLLGYRSGQGEPLDDAKSDVETTTVRV